MISIKNINPEDLTDVVVEGVDQRDYPEFCDAYISSASYNGKELPEEILEQISEDERFDYLTHQLAHESLISG